MSKANCIERITFFKNYFEIERKLFREEYFKSLEILKELHFLDGSTKGKS